ncbi:hypothetical protein ES677_06855 [Bizionia gelidisalsuginis]|uniref:HmuY family protein n=2 Tax=Bizionia TaxID=283785 RepID=A0A8H2QFF7_9FLAO|nr:MULTISPECIES: HmuY family protein [Bizionia]TYB75941.1 hypothetical protein ES676_05695 [Bizionia saleffrena]TYC13444.1 hypothetical protein ES677_06855 [Bizionia gelidisalsuginis]
MINKFFTLFLCTSVLAFTSCSSDDDTITNSGPIAIIVEGASLSPQIGGPNEQNQVYIDLSTNVSTNVQRDTWDLGFYSGDEFRVTINGSIYMATAALASTDIDAINSSNAEVVDLQPGVKVGTYDAISGTYIDGPSGAIDATAINEISSVEADNSVYLVNLGNTVGTTAPATGSVATKGDHRGWKKIRVLKSGNDYILQYADLDATTHQEVTISKTLGYNFTHFSFDTNSIISVEPAQSEWDLNFTVFTDEITGYGAYGYSDFVVINAKSEVEAYKIDGETEGLTYSEFTKADVVNANFSEDQRAIGGNWRAGGGPGQLPALYDTVFFILKDFDGNVYKIKFLSMYNDAGERGHPQFVYSLLQ